MDQEAVDLLNNIEKWTRVLAHDVLVEKLSSLDEKKLKVYDLSKQGTSQRDIADVLGVSQPNIGDIQEELFHLGVMEKEPVAGGGNRYIKIASLESLGLDSPIEE